MPEKVLRMKFLLLISVLIFSGFASRAQLILNEGSNKNYSTIKDEDSEYQDWVEIYNAGTDAVDLFNYSLSDGNQPGEWVFPHQMIQPGEFVLVFCSGKNRARSNPFTTVLYDTSFVPAGGWNTHRFSTPFYWDGLSSVVVNFCAYSDTYTNNTVFRQSATAFKSTTLAGGEPGAGSACLYGNGWNSVAQRPNIRFNNSIIGEGVIQNSEVDYPSPYGNWYWTSRHQLLFRAEELTAAGLSAGNIDSLAFDVVSTFPTDYGYIEISLANTGIRELGRNYLKAGGNLNHTSFGISSGGETIRLYNPAGQQISSLRVDCEPGYDVSSGSFPDGAAAIKKFFQPTPGASNNSALPADSMAQAPVFSKSSGVYNVPFSVLITNPNPEGSIYYTLDGSDPDTNAQLWNGTPVFIFQSAVLRARTFRNGYLPSLISSASYLFSISHTTPVISVISDPDALFGPDGMFENPTLDLTKASSIQYFDSSAAHNLIFSRRAGIVMDGGWGSRGLPQRPFRIKFDDGVLGEGPVNGNFLPDRPGRSRYSDFFLRNGSNQFMVLPYKDAAQVKMMADGSHNYYSAWKPVSVYINGQYWGLYELREKFNTEMFEEYDNASENSIEILGSSAQYGFQLRAIEGDVQNFYNSFQAFSQLNPEDSAFWEQADQHFDLNYYHDYIISEVWMNNADWGISNNIKIYRSDSTKYRWRYCLMDLEYGLLPNPSNDFSCSYDLLGQLKNVWPGADPGNPYIGVWWKGIQNDRFRNYFINRFADLMNSLYLPSRLLAIEESMFNRTVAEMAKQYQRWGDPFNVPAQMNGFYQNHLVFRDELACRPEKARNYLQSNFSLPQQVSVNLDVFPAEGGKIGISTLQPAEYPWNGVYFDGLPVKIEALPAPGYVFSHWEPNGLIGDTSNALFYDTLKIAAANFRAHFVSALRVQKTMSRDMFVFPNPASDKLNIRFLSGMPAEAANIRLADLPGREYRIPCVKSGKNQYTLDVSGLQAGFYLIQTETAGGERSSVSFLKSR